MTRNIVLGILVLSIVCAVGGHIYAQGEQLGKQAKTITAQAETIGEMQLTLAARDAVIGELRAGNKRDNAIVTETAEKIDALAASFRVLNRQTREALRNAPDLTLDSLLPAAAQRSFCLQYLAASGKIPANYPGSAPGNTDAGTAATAPAGSGYPAVDCSGFAKMTVRGAVEWSELLLKHAGDERTDKAALRKWAEEVGRNG